MDHCLYVATAFCGNYSAKRADKTRDAMTAMGISINAGLLWQAQRWHPALQLRHARFQVISRDAL